MALPKELLEKIVNLRDLRQAIHAVRSQNLKKDADATTQVIKPKEEHGGKPESAVPYEEYKKRYMSGELPASHIPSKHLDQMRSEGHLRHEDEKTQEIIPSDKKPYGIKHLGIKRSYGQVTHMWGIPGHHQHYELQVNKMGPKNEYTSKLVDSNQGGTIARSPHIHDNIKDAAVEIVNHFNTKRWSK